MRVLSIGRGLLTLSLLYLILITAGCGSGSGDTVSGVFKVKSISVTDLGTLGGSFSKAIKVNEKGQITGESETATGDTHAFIWQNGAMTDLGTLGGNYSRAADINDKGQIVGESTTSTGITHAFIWDNGVMTDLGTLTASSDSSTAFAINKHGQVVGNSWATPATTKGFIWQNGVMTDIGENAVTAVDINDSGVVTGTMAGGFIHAYIWQAGVMTDIGQTIGESGLFSNGLAINNKNDVIIGYSYSLEEIFGSIWHDGVWTPIATGIVGGRNLNSTAINEQGQVTGSYNYFNDDMWHNRAYVWQNGVFALLPVLNETDHSYGLAINNKGQVVGYTSDVNYTGNHASFWYNGTLTDLGAIGPAGSQGVANAINNHGQAVGYSETGEGTFTFHATLWTIN